MNKVVVWGIWVPLLLGAGGACAASSFGPTVHTPMNLILVEQGPAFEGVGLPAGYAWYKFAHHTHTTHSDGSATVGQRIQGAAADGADAVSILDHRTQDACSDPEFRTIEGCVPMCGEEWGWDGHLGMLNMQTGDPMVGWSLEQALPEALARGATLVVNHPRSSGGDPWPYDDLHLGIRGIEVWNSLSYAFSGSIESTAWWNDFLARGRMVFAIGGSDMHTMGSTLSPCNYVMATSSQPDAIQQAVEAGRISISADRFAARCFVWCDADADGAYETAMGTSLPVTTSRTLAFRIEVYSGQGRSLNVFTKNGLSTTLSVGEGTPWRVDFTAAVGPNTKDYLRAQIPDPADVLNPMDCITNPIYVNYRPEDADGDGLNNAFEIQIGTDMYAADTDGDRVSDAFEVGYDGNVGVYDPYNPTGNPHGVDLDAASGDTDGDGVKDGDELTYGFDPLDPSSRPVLPVSTGSLVVLLSLLVATGRALLRRMRLC